MKSIAVVDNDIQTYTILCNYLNRYFSHNHLIVDDYYDEADFCSSIENSNTYDLVFIDINIAKCTGLQASAKLRVLHKHTHIIFMSSYTDNLIPLFEFMPSGFLKKPINYCEFTKLINNVNNLFKINNPHILVKSRYCNIKVTLCDIIYAQIVNGRMVVIILSDNSKITTYEKLSDLYVRMSNFNSSIIQIHKSFLINSKHVLKFTHQNTTMDNGDILPISSSYRNEVYSFLTESLQFL